MELDPPGGLVQAERLGAGLASRKLGAAGRDLVRVGVPLEDGRAWREGAEDGVCPPRRRELDLVPADLRIAHRADARSRSSREHLRPEADAEDRDALREHVAEECLLVCEPRELVVLVRVLRPAEDHDRAVARGTSGPSAVGNLPALEGVPALLDLVLEDPAGHALPVRHGEDAHPEDSRRASVRWAEARCRPPLGSPLGRGGRAGSSRSAVRSRRGCC